MSLSCLVPRYLLVVGVLLASLSLDSRCQAQDTVARARPSTEATAAIRSALASEPEVLRRWYAARDHVPAWDAASVAGLTQFVENLDRHGLSPRLFDLDRWKASWNAWPTLPADQARLEIATTRLALHAIESLAYGFVDPTEVHSKWTALSRTVAPLALLEEGLRQGPERFPRWLEGAAAPPDPRYREMVTTLARYRQVASRGGWKSLPPSPGTVGPGQPYPHLTLLRARLQAEGDLAPAAPVKIRSKVLDPETTQALRSFQFRHGIAPDAVIGPQTLTELNQPVDRRLEAIVLNLDRLRYLSDVMPANCYPLMSSPAGGSTVNAVRRSGSTPSGSSPARAAISSTHPPAAFTTTGAQNVSPPACTFQKSLACSIPSTR